MKNSLHYFFSRKMLSPLLLAAFFLLFATACSIDSDTTLEDPNLNQIEKSPMLEMSKLFGSPEFQKALETINSNPNFRTSNQGNGAIVVSSPNGQYYFLQEDLNGDGDPDQVYFFGVPAGEFTQKSLPNGRVQIAVNSNNAEAFVDKVVGFIDFGFFKFPITEPLYSNICEGANGKLFGKVTASVTEIELWPGFVVSILEPGTADVLNLKATVKDSYKGDVFDWDTFESFPICEEPTLSKSLSIKILSIANNKNPKIKFDIKLD